MSVQCKSLAAICVAGTLVFLMVVLKGSVQYKHTGPNRRVSTTILHQLVVIKGFFLCGLILKVFVNKISPIRGHTVILANPVVFLQRF